MSGKSDPDYINVLKSHGLQVTYQRLAIYRELDESVEHPSAEHIFRQVRKRFPMISLGTVYKTLEKFHETGLVRRFGPETDVARYETITGPHHHLVCVKCKTIKDFYDTNSQISLSVPKEHGFSVLDHQLIVRGYCPDCAKD